MRLPILLSKGERTVMLQHSKADAPALKSIWNYRFQITDAPERITLGGKERSQLHC